MCFWSWQRYILLATKHIYCVFLIVAEVHSTGHKALILCVSDRDRGTFYWPQSTYIVFLIVTEVHSIGHKALILCFLSWQRYILLATKHLYCVFLIVTEVHSIGHKALILCVSDRDRGTFYWPQSTYIVCFWSWQRYILSATKHLHCVFLIVTEVHSIGHKALILCVSYRDRGTFYWPQSTYIVCFWSWQRYILLATKHLYCVSDRDRGTFYWPQSTYIVFLNVT